MRFIRSGTFLSFVFRFFALRAKKRNTAELISLSQVPPAAILPDA
jgi:hypothetical protein